MVTVHGPRSVLLVLMLPGHDSLALMGDLLAISRVPAKSPSAYTKHEVVARALENGATG